EDADAIHEPDQSVAYAQRGLVRRRIDQAAPREVLVVHDQDQAAVGHVAGHGLLQHLVRRDFDLRGYLDRRLLLARARPRLLEVRVVAGRLRGGQRVELYDLGQQWSHEPHAHHAAPGSAGRMNCTRMSSMSGSPVSAPGWASLSSV